MRNKLPGPYRSIRETRRGMRFTFDNRGFAEAVKGGGLVANVGGVDLECFGNRLTMDNNRKSGLQIDLGPKLIDRRCPLMEFPSKSNKSRVFPLSRVYRLW